MYEVTVTRVQILGRKYLCLSVSLSFKSRALLYFVFHSVEGAIVHVITVKYTYMNILIGWGLYILFNSSTYDFQYNSIYCTQTGKTMFYQELHGINNRFKLYIFCLAPTSNPSHKGFVELLFLRVFVLQLYVERDSKHPPRCSLNCLPPNQLF